MFQHLFIILAHYFLAPILVNMSILYVVGIMFVAIWFFIGVAYLMDHYVPKDFLTKLSITKFHHPSEKITEREMIPQIIFNLLFLFGTGYIYYGDVFGIGYTVRGFGSDITSLFDMIKDIFCSFVVYDGVFYYGHRLLHQPLFYRFHKKHHTTFGTIGMSAYYMDLLDFFLESIIPFYLGPIIFNISRVSLLCWGIIGAMNTTMAHSGYTIPLLLENKEHFFHHKKYNVNYSLYFFDTLHKTAAIDSSRIV